MAALGVPLMQTSVSQESKGRRIGKIALAATLLVGLVCVTFWALGGQVAAEDPATSMAIAQPMKVPNLRSPMVNQMRTRNYMTPVQASKSPNDDAVTPMSKRDMLGGAVAAAAAALPMAANAGVILEDPRKDFKAPERDPRSGLLLTVPAVAVGWVGFNILGPATDQLDTMGEVAKAREAPKRR